MVTDGSIPPSWIEHIEEPDPAQVYAAHEAALDEIRNRHIMPRPAAGFAGKPYFERGYLKIPPDELCLYHCVNAALNMDEYSRAPKSPDGFILGEAEQVFRTGAESIRSRLISLCEAIGRHSTSSRLQLAGPLG